MNSLPALLTQITSQPRARGSKEAHSPSFFWVFVLHCFFFVLAVPTAVDENFHLLPLPTLSLRFY